MCVFLEIIFIINFIVVIAIAYAEREICECTPDENERRMDNCMHMLIVLIKIFPVLGGLCSGKGCISTLG